ncbi:hypothetical protein VNI00_001707 [Paramarasmius palmivorus]|uniref:CN hydrolase domain-containing protein n=1 Tax=Paramarasmius palmivorus TaxID=297713 RepID=A0AAW0E152_9AGAR
MPITLNPSDGDTRKFKVAAIQAEPVWLDLQGGVEKTIRIIREAAGAGAKIIGFPEVFIPGYPWTPWANNFVDSQPVLKEYQANSLAVHSPEMDRIREVVKENEVNVVLGFAERDGASLYIAQVTITQDGNIANHRRKIKIFVGGWWPAFPVGQGGSPYIVSGEASSRMTQSVAMEGGCFGLACCQVVSEAGAEKMKMTGFPWFKFPGGGFSVVYGPDGGALTPPVDPGEEAIVYATISLDKINEVKLVADTMGN